VPSFYLWCIVYNTDTARSHVAATDMGRKLGGGCAPFGDGELGPRLTQCGLGRGLHPRQVSSWSKGILFLSTTNIFTFWRFGLYQRPSLEEVCSILLPVLAMIVMRRGKKSIVRTCGSACSCPRLSSRIVVPLFEYVDDGSVTLSHTFDRFRKLAIIRKQVAQLSQRDRATP